MLGYGNQVVWGVIVPALRVQNHGAVLVRVYRNSKDERKKTVSRD